MFLAASVTETVFVFIALALSIWPVLIRADRVSRLRQCAIPLQSRSRRATHPGLAPRRRQADVWRAGGGGVARTV